MSDTFYESLKSIRKPMGNIYFPPGEMYLVAIDPGVSTGLVWARYENGVLASSHHGVTLKIDPSLKWGQKGFRYIYWLLEKLDFNNSLTIIETYTARQHLYHSQIKAARIFGFLAGMFSTKSNVRYLYPAIWKPLWHGYLSLVNKDTKTIVRKGLGKRTSIHLRDAFSMFTLVEVYLKAKRGYYDKEK